MNIEEKIEQFKQELDELKDFIQNQKPKFTPKIEGYAFSEYGNPNLMLSPNMLYFKNADDALRAHKRRLADAEQWKLAEYLNGTVDWMNWKNDRQQKYCQYLDEDGLHTIYACQHRYSPNHFYFKSKELVEQAELLASENLKDYWMGKL